MQATFSPHLAFANRFVSLYRFREFIFGSVKREFQQRYQNSALGAAWLVIQPLALILVYTLIFSEIMRARLPDSGKAFAYSIFLCAGSLTWGLFAEIVGRSQNVFIENAGLLKKLNFPKLCLPVIVILNAFVSFGIIFSIYLAFLLVTNNFPGWVIFWAVPLLALQALLGLGLGMILGVLNVFFRDVGQLFGIVLQYWFWLTPIIYPLTSLPENIQRWVMLNPMTPITVSYQGIFLQGKVPQMWNLLPHGVAACVLCVIGLWLYKRLSGDLVDEL